MADIRSKISLDASGFTAGVNKAMSSLGSMTGKIGSAAAMGGAALAAIGAPLTAGAFLIGAKDALDFGGAISDMSAKTGIAAKDLVILGQAFKNAGMDSSQVGSSVNRLQKALAGVNEDGQPTNEMFNRLGLDMQKVAGMDPSAQLQTVGAAIGNLSNPTERSAAAMAIFGKSGGDMLALFRDPKAIETATKQVGAQAEVMQRSADQMDAVSDAFGAVKSTLQGFFVGLVEPLLPMLNALSDWLNSLGSKAVEFGATLGKHIASAFNILRNGFKQDKLGELAGLALKIGFGDAVNYLVGGLRSALMVIPSLLSAIFSQDYGNYVLGALSAALKGAVVIFGTLLADVINGIAALLYIGFEKAVGAFYAIKGFFNSVIAYVTAGITTAVQKIISLLPKRLRPEGFQKKSFDENLADAKAAQENANPSDYKPLTTSFADALKQVEEGGGLKDTLNAIKASAKTDAAVAAEAVKALFGRIKEDMIAIGKDFKPAEVIDTAEWKTQIAALAKQLNVPIETVAAAAESAAKGTSLKPATPTGPEAKEAPQKDPVERKRDVDQFAKIGLFAGGRDSNAAANHAQKTADNTARTADLLAGGIVTKPETKAAPPVVTVPPPQAPASAPADALAKASLAAPANLPALPKFTAAMTPAVMPTLGAMPTLAGPLPISPQANAATPAAAPAPIAQNQSPRLGMSPRLNAPAPARLGLAPRLTVPATGIAAAIAGPVTGAIGAMQNLTTQTTPQPETMQLTSKPNLGQAAPTAGTDLVGHMQRTAENTTQLVKLIAAGLKISSLPPAAAIAG